MPSPTWAVSEGSGTPQEFRAQIATCPISRVVLFNDCAEVTRAVTFAPRSVGEMSLVLTGLTQKADTETIRVNRMSGRCTILEVGFEVRHHAARLDAEAGRTSAAQKLEVKRLQELMAAKRAERARLQQKRSYVESYLATLVKESKVTELELMGKAFDFHCKCTAEIDEELAACDRELERLQLEATAANCQAVGESLMRTEESRDVTLQIDVLDISEEVVLNVIYMVTGASWSPSYDIRVACNSDTEATMSLTYFGLVKQATGEDWRGCSMSLSTAMPSKSGVAPTPARKTVRFVNDSAPRRQDFVSRLRNLQSNMLHGQPSADWRRLQHEAAAEEARRAAVADAGAGNTSFTVERKVNIDSDDRPHKVTIAVLELMHTFMYFTVPEQEEKVYVQVRVMNDSSYKLLASSKVAVFFNGSFITTTEIGDTNPGEEINTFLGQDTSVKVEHKKLKVEHVQATRFMSSAQSTKYGFLTVVTNMKKVPVSVKVVGCVPRSCTDSIHVKLQKPRREELVDEKHARDDNVTMQNAVTNNVVWVRKVGPGQKVELPLDYTVAWPRGKHVEISS